MDEIWDKLGGKPERPPTPELDEWFGPREDENPLTLDQYTQAEIDWKDEHASADVQRDAQRAAVTPPTREEIDAMKEAIQTLYDAGYRFCKNKSCGKPFLPPTKSGYEFGGYCRDCELEMLRKDGH